MDDGFQIEDDPIVDEDVESNDRDYQLIAIVSAVVNVVAFTGVGVFALDNAVYGGIAGVFAGVGSYLFLPWLLSVSAVQEQSGGNVPFPEVSRQVAASGQLGVLGVGLEMGSVLMLAYAFRTETAELGTGVAIGVGAALVAYLAGSSLLDL